MARKLVRCIDCAHARPVLNNPGVPMAGCGTLASHQLFWPPFERHYCLGFKADPRPGIDEVRGRSFDIIKRRATDRRSSANGK